MAADPSPRPSCESGPGPSDDLVDGFSVSSILTGERRRVTAPLVEFLRTEAAGGAVMLVAVAVALVWVNASASYHRLFEHVVSIGSGSWAVELDVHGWINEGLMTLFFFVVGLEIKRELIAGELRDRRTASLPVLAALGGMVVPALLYLAMNGLGGDAGRGWAVPVATDIAFATGVLVLLGARVPAGLRIFLLTLAVADDIGGIVVIAVFYATDVAVGWLLGAGLCYALIIVMARRNVHVIMAYVPVGIAAWYCMVRAGVEPAIAGVIIGLLTPVHPIRDRLVMPVIEHRLLPWTSFVIVPLFAVANAGVEINGEALRQGFGDTVTWGIVVGLFAGKTIGISLATWLAVRFRVGRLPQGVEAVHILGAAILAGIGFTVALFVASLAFEDAPLLLDQAKLGILAASALSAVVGSLVLARASAHRRRPHGGRSQPAPGGGASAPDDGPSLRRRRSRREEDVARTVASASLERPLAPEAAGAGSPPRR